MSPEKRQSLRISTSLPGQWQTFDQHPTSRNQVMAVFGLREEIDADNLLASLSREFQHALEKITDRDTRYALNLLDRRLAILTGQQNNADKPSTIEAGLSAAGAEFASDLMIPPDTWVGVHLVLDEDFHFVNFGQVSHSEPVSNGGFRFGMAFADTTSDHAKRLARFVLRHSGDVSVSTAC